MRDGKIWHLDSGRPKTEGEKNISLLNRQSRHTSSVAEKSRRDGFGAHRKPLRKGRKDYLAGQKNWGGSKAQLKRKVSR